MKWRNVDEIPEEDRWIILMREDGNPHLMMTDKDDYSFVEFNKRQPHLYAKITRWAYVELSDESPTPTSIKTAEEILEKHLRKFIEGNPGYLLKKSITELPEYESMLLAMQEYKNQFTGDKWGDEDLKEAYLAGWDEKWGSPEVWLSNYKKSKQ